MLRDYRDSSVNTESPERDGEISYFKYSAESVKQMKTSDLGEKTIEYKNAVF